jgi:polyisoprenoid-binding protein YceI
MNTRIATLAVTTLLAGTAVAAPETYEIDSRHTFPSFEVNHLGFSTQRGRFNITTGTVVLDKAARKASADVSINVRSIDTGLDKLEAHLVAEDFFDAGKYPTITFKSTTSQFQGDKLVALDGNLTMRGVTKPVKLTVATFNCAMHPMLKKQACGADAVTTIKRSDYGINYALPAVGDEVKLLIQIEAVKK